VHYYFNHYSGLNKKDLLSYKGYLVENASPQTVNLRMQGVNKYLEFKKLDKLKLKFVKVQQKNFLENVISDADYKFFKSCLKKDGRDDWYFVVWFLAATGSRVSELLQIKVEHVKVGYLDLYTKGGKIRRLYIPKHLRMEALSWIERRGLKSGYLFLNRFGQRITTRGIAQQLKHYAVEYGLNPQVVYPHSFRHRYAKNFLDKFNDISLLADLMGHESIETTRIYLRRTSTEQQVIVDKIVTW
jgi:integrase